MWAVFVVLCFLSSVMSEHCPNMKECKVFCNSNIARFKPKSCECECLIDDIMMPVSKKKEGGKAASVSLARWDETTEDGCIRIPFHYDKTIEDSENHKQAINRAMGIINAMSCLKFEPAQVGDIDYIEFFVGTGCWSYFGKQGGLQQLSIGAGCDFVGVVLHELFHALGFWHEQSRPDRDEYIIIVSENIVAGKEHNFDKETDVNTSLSAYDFTSVMHYDSYAFSKNVSYLPTMLKRPDNSTFETQTLSLSAEDQAQLLAMYSCNSKRGIPETQDCYHPLDRGFSYRGNASTTISGNTCQRWDSQSPQSHIRIPALVTGSGLEENYCRNPGGFPGGPWCYTTNVTVRLEECGIPICNNSVPEIADSPPLVSVPGFWSKFTELSPCVATCGFQYRTRHCVGAAPNSENCPGEYWEAVACPCFGTWSPWSAFSECSKWCNEGEKMRVRTCSTDLCDGTPFEKETCNNKPCPYYPYGGCFDKSNLDSYRGRNKLTATGQECIKWKHSPETPQMHPNKNLRNKNCRNPTDQPTPFCYVSPTEHEPCNVSLCNEDAKWSQYSNWSSCDCESGKRYRVRQCEGGVKKQGMCKGKQWKRESCTCETTPLPTVGPPVTPLPPMTTPATPEAGCITLGNASSYRGNVNTTYDGNTCQRWDSQVPHAHNYSSLQEIADLGLAENYCRAPDEGDTWAWCYVLSFSVVKEKCDVPECIPDPPPPVPAIGCLPDNTLASHLAYRGGLNTTENGFSCQRWDLNTPQSHIYKSYNYPQHGLGAHNYCRSAGFDPAWCHTTDPNQVWDNCAIPICGSAKPNL